MEGRPEITMEQVRVAVKSLGEGGALVSNAELFEALGLEIEADKARLRNRMQEMVATGEVSRVREGIYVYNFEQCQVSAKYHKAMWRFVRSQKPGWSVRDMSLFTRASYSHACKYCSWLKDEGYIEQIGKNGLTKIYAGTGKAMATPETPHPPQKINDPYQEERSAAAKIIRLMLCADVGNWRVQKAIVDACDVLRRRFAKHENQGGMEDVQQ